MNRENVVQFLKKFSEENRDRYHIRSLGVFGSVARDAVRDDSDVDVVVELANQDLFDLIGIKQAIEEGLHCPVDLVSYRKKMNAFLKKRIDQEAVYV